MNVLPDYQNNDYAVYAVFPHDRQIPPKVQVFIDYLETHFGHPPYWDRTASTAHQRQLHCGSTREAV